MELIIRTSQEPLLVRHLKTGLVLQMVHQAKTALVLRVVRQARAVLVLRVVHPLIRVLTRLLIVLAVVVRLLAVPRQPQRVRQLIILRLPQIQLTHQRQRQLVKVSLLYRYRNV